MQIPFPYPKIRPIQEAFIKEILNSYNKDKHLIAHVPTGVGKTAASLHALLPIALKNNQTIFFLTPKHIQHKIVIETIERINKNINNKIKVVDFIGKRHMCSVSGVNSLSQQEFYNYCNDLREKDECQFYNNVKNKSKTSIESELVLKELNSKTLHVQDLCSICKKHKLCAHEMACILAKGANVIIADYFHILDPNIRELLLTKINKTLIKSVLIFDESHNLPSRIKDILTSSLSSFVINNAIKESELLKNEEITGFLKELNDILVELSKKMSLEANEALIKKQEFTDKIKADYNKAIISLSSLAESIIEDKKFSYLSSVASFLEAWKGIDIGFARILTRDFTKKGKPFLSLTYRCLDPSLIFNPLSLQTNFILLMSGTLSPTSMYKDLLNINANLAELKNPFPEENRLNLIIPDTSTKFTLRSEEMYKRIASYLLNITSLVPGNSLIFFPSYDIRDKINKYFSTLSEKTILLEYPNLIKQEKEEIVDKFKTYKNIGANLLAASSGSFGEGIDLPGDLLKAVIIVGLPLSKPDLETKELISYYDLRFNKGWDYGYIYPAVIKSLQNAGRCIRSKKDKGVIIFLDERYVWNNFRKCFPSDLNIEVSKNPGMIIEDFFSLPSLKKSVQGL